MMRRFAKHAALLAVIVLLLVTSSACSYLARRLDVIASGSVTAFEAVLTMLPDQVQADAATGRWSLSAPDGSARLLWHADAVESPSDGFRLALDATPFLGAGLDTSLLPDGYIVEENVLLIGITVGDGAGPSEDFSSPIAAYARIVERQPDIVGYHAAFDHYGVMIGDGNMFEWAKDTRVNDKDIVFALNPGPLIAAGVNPEAVEGWVFAKVPMHSNGKNTVVDKLLKPFDID